MNLCLEVNNAPSQPNYGISFFILHYAEVCEVPIFAKRSHFSNSHDWYYELGLRWW